MNESFIYAICSERHIPAALCILRRMAIDLRMTKNYKPKNAARALVPDSGSVS
jgi:hypothetical protein